MKKHKKNNLKFLILVSLLATSCISKENVDLIIHNGTIYTLNAYFDIDEAIAIKEGKILASGKNNQILNKYTSAQTIDLKGKYAYPGFIDAHCHLLSYGLQKQQVELSSCQSFEEVIELMKDFSEKSDNNWLIGNGWDQNKWPNKKWPTNKALNNAFPNHNVVINRIDGHALMANEKAIVSSNIKMDTTVFGGHIEIIEGKPTGIFVDNAMDLILNQIPEPSEELKKSALIEAQKNCFAKGLTTVDIAGLIKEDIELIDKLHKTDELEIKTYIMLADNEENFQHYVFEKNAPLKSNKMTISSFKFFADGSLGSRGACLIKPYQDNKNTHGQLLQNIASYKSKLSTLKEYGFQACTHAIGDSANRIISHAYANVLEGQNDLRWRIEHVQCISPEDIHVIKENNIIPSVQPTHATSDFSWAILRLGKERLNNCYRYFDLMNQNGLIALGTDFPVEKINPIHTFYAAVFRKNFQNKPLGGFQINESLSRVEALKGMTIWAAIANFEENEKGTLEINKCADITILNTDLLNCEEEKVLSSKVNYTIVDGEIVYEN